MRLILMQAKTGTIAVDIKTELKIIAITPIKKALSNTMELSLEPFLMLNISFLFSFSIETSEIKGFICNFCLVL
jgi:hypothetical protein